MAKIDSEDVVLADVADGIVTLTLNRPHRGNAWNSAVSGRYFSLLQEVARDPEIRVIILTGAGKAFCTGGDAEKLSEVAAQGNAQSVVSLPFWLPLRIGKPIIAAVNGACFGLGLQQALCCDLRFASEDAKFATAYARRGLVAEFGMSWLLPRLIGTGHAMDLLLSARLVRAPEAAHIGLVNRVVPAANLITEATSYARQLADHCSPRSMRSIKRQVYMDLMSTLFSSYGRSEAMLAEAIKQPDFKEGVASWRENRAAAFPSLPEELAFIDFEEG
jgi:enoyl-CoA hydratase/carnithine racemase